MIYFTYSFCSSEALVCVIKKEKVVPKVKLTAEEKGKHEILGDKATFRNVFIPLFFLWAGHQKEPWELGGKTAVFKALKEIINHVFHGEKDEYVDEAVYRDVRIFKLLLLSIVLSFNRPGSARWIACVDHTAPSVSQSSMRISTLTLNIKLRMKQGRNTARNNSKMTLSFMVIRSASQGNTRLFFQRISSRC